MRLYVKQTANDILVKQKIFIEECVSIFTALGEMKRIT